MYVLDDVFICSRFIVIVGQLIKARKFIDSFFNLGEPNLILVPSGKVLIFVIMTFCLYLKQTYITIPLYYFKKLVTYIIHKFL